MKLCAPLFFFFFASDLCANIINFTGKAHDLTNGDFLYTEHHQVTLDDKGQYTDSQVTYRNIDGDVIAKKQLIFDNIKTLPDFEFKDLRTNTEIQVEKENDTFQVAYESSGDVVSETINIDNKIVVDAGFDQLMIKHWTDLLKGKALKFQFLAPTRGELIGFQLLPKKQDETVIHFILQPQSWLIRMLVDDIELTYAKASKRILKYEGLTNIEEVNKGRVTGNYYEARIEYSY